ncbi:Ribosomal protein 60S [Heracleum sosnowskyi]|uniref:Ribosomal protein 60S n=1 Tax=Heracleum sosnowskyi TaxID=360622 RepID=A0AAD8II04_9APIA|nr:Ribosomal protein 60S [Heracleum sosnowskyi]
MADIETLACLFLHFDHLVLFIGIGADGDDDKIELLLSEVKGKDITELIAFGREKLASVPSGGGGVAVAAAASGGGGAAAPAAEAKKVEKEESDDVSLVILFTDFIFAKTVEHMC